MTLRLILTDGNGIGGLTAAFGAFINTQIADTFNDAQAAAASAASAEASDQDAQAQVALAAAQVALAQTQATNAATSATASANSATASAASATTSSTAATNSAASATAASGSAASAAAQVPLAAAQVTLATAQATAASGSATAALASANAASVSAANAAASALAAAALVSTKNRVINGDMRVVQRIAGITLSGTAGTTITGYGGPDTWRLANSAGGIIEQGNATMVVNGINTPCLFLQPITANPTLTGTNQWATLHIFEGNDVYDLLNSPMTISFWLVSSVVGLHAVSLRDSAAANSYVVNCNIAVANVAQFFSFTAPANPSLSIPSGTGQALLLSIAPLTGPTLQCPTANLNSWQTGNFISSANAVNWAASTANTIKFTNVKLEAGLNPTAFVPEDIDTATRRCQRRFRTGQYTFQQGVIVSITYTANGFFGTPMRAVPTLVGTVAGTPVGFAATIGALSSDLTHMVESRACTATGQGSFVTNYTASADF